MKETWESCLSPHLFGLEFKRFVQQIFDVAGELLWKTVRAVEDGRMKLIVVGKKPECESCREVKSCARVTCRAGRGGSHPYLCQILGGKWKLPR